MPSMPYGFKLNTQETILKKTYLNEQLKNKTYYVWADADGTEHCFFQSDNLVCLSLKLQNVVFAVTISELYSRTVWETKLLFSRVILRDPL